MSKILVKCMTKTAEDSVKAATKRKQDQHILLKVHDTDLAAREAHYHATCRRDYTREDDRYQQTIKDTQTIEELASNQIIYVQYTVQYVMGNSFRDKEITTLRKNYETEHSMHLLCRVKLSTKCVNTPQRCINNAHQKGQLSST